MKFMIEVLLDEQHGTDEDPTLYYPQEARRGVLEADSPDDVLKMLYNEWSDRLLSAAIHPIH